MEYMTVKETAQKWQISDRRVRILCSEGKIPNAVKEGRSYMIPKETVKPADGRSRKGKKFPEQYKEQFDRIDAKKAELERMRPLTTGELQRLQEEFLLEFTFNSN